MHQTSDDRTMENWFQSLMESYCYVNQNRATFRHVFGGGRHQKCFTAALMHACWVCRNPHVILGSSSYFAAVASAKMAAKPYWEAVKTIVCQFNNKGLWNCCHLLVIGANSRVFYMVEFYWVDFLFVSLLLQNEMTLDLLFWYQRHPYLVPGLFVGLPPNEDMVVATRFTK